MSEILEQNIISSEEEEIGELLPEAVAELRLEMWAKIGEALDLGVFTGHEAREWENGFEACDRLEYMENLVEIVDDFIASGLEVVEQITAALNTDLLTTQEKTNWEIRMEMLSFEDKIELIHELSAILREVNVLKQKLAKLISNPLMAGKAQEIDKNFAEADASAKEGILTRAALTAAEIATQSKQVSFSIRSFIKARQFEAAREALWDTAMDILTDNERAHLVSEIDQAEIAHSRESLWAA